MRIIGVDPGTARLGWGVIDIHGQREVAVAYGCIETDKGNTPGDRLCQLYEELNEILAEFKPTGAVIEQLFFAKNQTTAMAVSQARGIIVLALAQQKIPFSELSPRQAKSLLTGSGAADKKQMQFMVQQLLKLDKIPKPDDAADGLALALAGWRMIPQDMGTDRL